MMENTNNEEFIKGTRIPKTIIRNTIILILAIIVVGELIQLYIDSTTKTLRCTYHEEYTGITADITDEFTFRNDTIKTGKAKVIFDFRNASNDYSEEYKILKNQAEDIVDTYEDSNWDVDTIYDNDYIEVNANVDMIDSSASQYTTMDEYKDHYEAIGYTCETID